MNNEELIKENLLLREENEILHHWTFKMSKGVKQLEKGVI